MKAKHGLIFGFVIAALLLGTPLSYYMGAFAPWGIGPNVIQSTTTPSNPGPQPPAGGCPSGTYWNGASCINANTHTSAPFYLGVVDPLAASPATATTTAYVLSFDKSTLKDTITINAAGVAGAVPVTAGNGYFIQIKDTTTNHFYEGWFEIDSVGDNAPVYAVVGGIQGALGNTQLPTGSQAIPSAIAAAMAATPLGSIAKVQVSTLVWYSTGAAVYWQIVDPLPVFQREASGNLNINLFKTDRATSISTATGTTATTGTPDSATATHLYAAPASDFDMFLSIGCADKKMVYGWPEIYIGSAATGYAWQIGYLGIAVSYNITSVNQQQMSANGWKPIQTSSTPGYLNFYQVMAPLVGTGTSTCGYQYTVHVSTSTGLGSGTAFSYRIWVADIQSLADMNSGISDSAPTAYGGVNSYSLTATIYSSWFTIASNKPTSQLTYAQLTSV